MSNRLVDSHHFPMNPLMAHEFRSLMRNPRTYAILTIYMSIASGITVLVYLVTSGNGANGVNDSSRVGTALFYIVVGLQILLVSFVTPSFTSNAISVERENDTYDLLRMTSISPGQIVTAKLLSGFGFTVLLVLATLPLLSLALLLGGIEPVQLIAALLVIFSSALLFCSLGVYISTRVSTSLAGTILTYSITLGIVLGMSVLTLIALPILNDVIFGTSSLVKTSPFLATLLQLLMFGLMSISPISSIVASESNLMQGGRALTVVINPLPGTTSDVTIPAPFLIMTVIYILVSVFLMVLATRRLKQIEDRS